MPESVSVFFGGGKDLCNRVWAISTALSKLLFPYDTAHGCLFNLNSHALFLSSRNSSSSLEMGYGHRLLMTLLTKSISERDPPIRINLLVPKKKNEYNFSQKLFQPLIAKVPIFLETRFIFKSTST